jgi:hypothetical protein
MPRIPAAASVAGSGAPADVDGVATTIDGTPATCAGTTVMSSEEGRGALPPGT